jgi:hypothetical protein
MIQPTAYPPNNAPFHMRAVRLSGLQASGGKPPEPKLAGAPS